MIMYAMDDTTLVTFFLETPRSVGTVELLGSWDNFTKPYAMIRDPRRGRSYWTGCYLFENIICDGDPAATAGKRTGGLKMGGTYWYYFMLDGEKEFYDEARPSTSNCPLLPGQRMNVLDVPYDSQSTSRSSSISSTSSDIQMTMDPADKFRNPRPPPVPTQKRQPQPGSDWAEGRFPPFAPFTAGAADERTSFSAGFIRSARSRSPLRHRKIRSAGSSSAVSLKSAFSVIKGSGEPSRPTKQDEEAPFRTEKRGRSKQRRVSPMEISEPTLVSRTDDYRTCYPLPHSRTSRSPPRPSSSRGMIPLFSPLSSHPVNLELDNPFILDNASANAAHQGLAIWEEDSSDKEVQLAPASRRVPTGESHVTLEKNEVDARARSGSRGRIRDALPVKDSVLPRNEMSLLKDIQEVKHADEETSNKAPTDTTSAPARPQWRNFSRPSVSPQLNETVPSPHPEEPSLDKVLPLPPADVNPPTLQILTSGFSSAILDDFTNSSQGEPSSRFSAWSSTSLSADSDTSAGSPTYSAVTDESGEAHEIRTPRYSHDDILDYYVLDERQLEELREIHEETERTWTAGSELHTPPPATREPPPQLATPTFQIYSLLSGTAAAATASVTSLNKTPTSSATRTPTAAAFMLSDSPDDRRNRDHHHQHATGTRPSVGAAPDWARMQELVGEFGFLGGAVG